MCTQVSPGLEASIRQVMAEVNGGKFTDGWDRVKLEKLLAMQQACMDSFHACIASLPDAEKTHKLTKAE